MASLTEHGRSVKIYSKRFAHVAALLWSAGYLLSVAKQQAKRNNTLLPAAVCCLLSHCCCQMPQQDMIPSSQ